MTIIRIGLDTSKSVFQVHGVDTHELPVVRRQLRRGQMEKFFAKLPPTRIGLEAGAVLESTALLNGFVVNLVRSGVVDPLCVLSQVEPLGSALEAYQAFDERQPGWMKVELEPALVT